MLFDEKRMRSYAGDVIFRRGVNYFRDGRVHIVELSDTHILASVRGSGRTYDVEWFYMPERDGWGARCNCPYDYGSVCKHIVAVGLTANALYKRGSDGKQKVRASSLAKLFQVDKPDIRHIPNTDSALIFNLNLGSDTWHIRPVARYIKKDGSFGREIKLRPYGLTEDRIRFSNEERIAANIIWTTGNMGGYWYDINPVPHFRYGSDPGPLLRFLKECHIRLEEKDVPVTIYPQPLDLRIRMKRIDKPEGTNAFELEAAVDDGADLHEPLDQRFLLLAGGNVILFRDYTLYEIKGHVESRFLIPFLSQGGRIEFEEKELEIFIESILPHLSDSEHQVMLPEDLVFESCDTVTSRKLYLEEHDGMLHVYARFEYGMGNEVKYPDHNPVNIIKNESGWVRIQRQNKVEDHAIQIVREHGLIESDAGWFSLRAKKNPIPWLFEELPLLASEGFTILGEEKLDKLKIRRAVPALFSTVVSGQDWFDLQVDLDFDGMRVAIEEVLKHLRTNKNFITLSNGYTVNIDDEILRKIGFIDAFGQKSESHQGRRFSKTHLMLLELILQESENHESDDTFKKAIAGIRDFTNIEERPVPEAFTGTLRHYQKAGYDWLHFLKDYHFGGCLADDMGLGKTVQTLAFLAQVIPGSKGKPVLIVAPTSVIYNWGREIERFTPWMDYYIYHGLDREKDYELLSNTHIILTSYALIWRDFEFLREIPFYYIILDESQKIKNVNSLTARSVGKLQSAHRLALTGTPIENNLSELWSQFNFLNPGMLGSLKSFQEYFGRAVELNGDEATAEKLRKIIYPFILRRKKEDVAKELPPKTEIVTYCEMDDGQRKVYEKWRDYYRAAILDKIDKDGLNKSKIKVLEGLTRLRQISIHPALVEGGNSRLESEKFLYLFEQLEEILSEHHKVLVFSQFVKALTLLRCQLDEKAVDYAYLDGRTRDRVQQIDRFQTEDACSVFLISLKAGGTGLNLTAADYVFHLDPWWNPAVEQQASDRAHRIGQTRQVFVYKLITKDSVEEKILAMQEKKKALSDSIVTTDSAFFKTLSRSDIEVLFS